ncbi:MAG: hypothetical protein SVX43_03445 [Cyanobacteriota bacterium]|nr:hypothetical protein [Cyanobacteriota bacterium]
MTLENHVSNLDEYRSLYLRSGFQNVELIDATQECSVRYYQRLLDFLQKKIAITWSGKIRFEATKRYFLSSMNATRYYLLVGAIKPPSSETTDA